MKTEHKLVFKTIAKLLLLLLLAGCSAKASQPDVPAPAPTIAVPLFPPGEAVNSGDHSGFAAANKEALKGCDSDDGCATALFNLGVIHAYPPAPCYNQAEALKYFGALIRKYPNSPRACQAKVWLELLKKTVASEKSRRQLQQEIDAGKSAIEGLNEQIRRSRQIDSEIDRKERELLK
jgi:hypothetical protein